ncbi:hypothetical protein [Micromonospora endolithica]|uniref:Uncharacterized protein n=1 Tax=Micromonospora endolithica TaxID=230091 RepID=A0A3A9ZKP1_9ACTN|nr:hypothetical protein [Micromonospora endolithica]RKN48404.1 hypothetical protein D7223_10390 [Micromonospora endolithica]TWJ24522.1 hypothetical protein JD76_04674 [Micromonospora endolithica]
MRATRSLLPVVAALALATAASGCQGVEEEPTVSGPQSPAPTPPGGTEPPAGPTATPPAGSVAPSGRTGPSLSPTRPPTPGPPTALPSRPTDLRRVNALAGRITRGGDGPCYGLVTDDGREYALHGVGKGSFATGTWVQVTIGPADPAADCGSGTPATLVKIAPIG